MMRGLERRDFSMPRAAAALCHPLLRRLTWELPAAEAQPFIPGDYKLQMRGEGIRKKKVRKEKKKNQATP